MKNKRSWKFLAVFLAAALLIAAAVVIPKPDSRILAAGDTYKVTDETTLSDAMGKINDNDTIVLEGDITLSNMHFLDVQKTITLNLNGHILASAPGYDIIDISGQNKIFTLEDSAGGGQLLGDDNTIRVKGSGNQVIINGGDLKTNLHQTIAVIGDKNQLTVNNGSIHNGVWAAGTNLALAIHGGQIQSDETAVEISGTVKMDMDGGAITAVNLALSIEDELLKSAIRNAQTGASNGGAAANDAASAEPSGETTTAAPETTTQEETTTATPETTTQQEPTTAAPETTTPETTTKEEPTTQQPDPPKPSALTDVTINISGGTLESTADSAIFFPEKGTMNISGGTFKGHTALYLQSGNTTITGGTFIANGNPVEFADTKDFSGCTATGDAIVVEACQTGTSLAQVSIQGGTFTSANGKPIASYQASDDPTWASDGAQRLSKFVSGGWFSSKVSNAGDVYTQDILAAGLSATEACAAEEGAQEGAPFSVGYQLSFDANGGNAVSDVYIVPIGDPQHRGVLKALPVPTRDNCSFAGWFDKADGGNEVKAGTQVAFTADTKLFAHWNISQYKITYNLDGGKVAQNNPETYTADTPDFTLTNPTKDGFYFAGWTGTGLNAPTKTVKITKGSSGDRAYTATWGRPGEIKNGTDEKTNACHAYIYDSIGDLSSVVLNADDINRRNNGENITIGLKSEDVTTTITQENKAIIAEGLNLEDQVGVYLDMTLYKIVGSDEPKAVTNPKGNVTVMITVPEELLYAADGSTRTFGVAHLHNGFAQKLDVLYNEVDHELTFTTSAFSVFALTYTDAEVPDEPVGPVVPGGGGTKPGSIFTSWIFWLIVALVVVIAVVIIIAVTMKKKKNKNRKNHNNYNHDNDPDNHSDTL